MPLWSQPLLWRGPARSVHQIGTLLLVLVISGSGIRVSRTRPQVAQDGGLLRFIELQVADQQVPQLVRHRLAH